MDAGLGMGDVLKDVQRHLTHARAQVGGVEHGLDRRPGTLAAVLMAVSMIVAMIVPMFVGVLMTMIVLVAVLMFVSVVVLMFMAVLMGVFMLMIVVMIVFMSVTVLVLMAVIMFMSMLMFVTVVMLMSVFMAVIVFMAVLMSVFVLMAMIVAVFVAVIVGRIDLAVDDDIELARRGRHAGVHIAQRDLDALKGERVDGLLNDRHGDSKVHQRGHRHVASDAGDQIEVKVHG